MRMLLARVKTWLARLARAVRSLFLLDRKGAAPVGSGAGEERMQGPLGSGSAATRLVESDVFAPRGDEETGGSRSAEDTPFGVEAIPSQDDFERTPRPPVSTEEEDGVPVRVSKQGIESDIDAASGAPDAGGQTEAETSDGADTEHTAGSLGTVGQDESCRPRPEPRPWSQEDSEAVESGAVCQPAAAGPTPEPEIEAGVDSLSGQGQAKPRRRVAPEKRGGRPRDSNVPIEDGQPSATPGSGKGVGSLRPPRPELICWKEAMAWKIGVEVPEDLREGDLSVIQDGEELQQDAVHEMRWPLTEPLASVEVRWFDESDAAECSRIFGASQHRVFKIAASGDKGRAVSRVTRGHYIVISPRAFTRDEAGSGPAPVAPEYVLPETAEVIAHHLLADTESAGLLLRGDAGANITIRPLRLETYRLAGHLIEDAHPTAGPLFGGEPPHLVVEEPPEPAQVVVGLEGQSVRGRARHTAATFEDLRDWFDHHQPAWFFVRLYDAHGDLLESVDFRYAKALEGIEIDDLPALPPAEGHSPAEVHFRLADGLTVLPLDTLEEMISLPTLPTEGFVLPARPDAGQATLRLQGERGSGVDVVVKVPRVWWALTSTGDGDNSLVWIDRLLTLSPNDFLPTSRRQVSVLLPEPGWADALVVGFRDSSPKRVPILCAERRIDYPLRNLGGDEALVRDSASELLISLETAATRLGPVAVGQVMPDSKEKERDQPLKLPASSCPRLMSTLTRIARSAPPPTRRAVRFLRETYYRRSRKGGEAEKREFLFQGFSLLAALLERGIPLAVPRRRRRQAEELAASEPGAVASWQLRLRRAECSTGWKDLADKAGKRQ